jgi:hypothetical protein
MQQTLKYRILMPAVRCALVLFFSGFFSPFEAAGSQYAHATQHKVPKPAKHRDHKEPKEPSLKSMRYNAIFAGLSPIVECKKSPSSQACKTKTQHAQDLQAEFTRSCKVARATHANGDEEADAAGCPPKN